MSRRHAMTRISSARARALTAVLVGAIGVSASCSDDRSGRVDDALDSAPPDSRLGFDLSGSSAPTGRMASPDDVAVDGPRDAPADAMDQAQVDDDPVGADDDPAGADDAGVGIDSDASDAVVADTADGANPDLDPDAPLAEDVADEEAPPEPKPPDLIPLDPGAVEWDDEVMVVEEVAVAEDACSVAEGCVARPGVRRVLRFSARTANAGEGDISLGLAVVENPNFIHDECRDELMVNGFEHRFELLRGDDEVVSTGRKRSFCMADSVRYSSTARSFPRFTCFRQGISPGWYDLYPPWFDCQWIDITDLPAGDYGLRLTLDAEDFVAESNETNNQLLVPVSLPGLDLTEPCAAEAPSGPDRSCGFTAALSAGCDPGAFLEVGCSAQPGCTAGTACTGNPVVRVCDGADPDCSAGRALVVGDDACGSSCPYVGFDCPGSGSYTVWTAPYEPDGTDGCEVGVVTEARPDPIEACGEGAVVGLDRECGWTIGAAGLVCDPGFTYLVGCNSAFCSLEAVCSEPSDCGLEAPACSGDPMLRVCPGDGPCPRSTALAESDGACGDACPEVLVTCPGAGTLTVLTAPTSDGQAAGCDAVVVRLADL